MLNIIDELTELVEDTGKTDVRFFDKNDTATLRQLGESLIHTAEWIDTFFARN